MRLGPVLLLLAFGILSCSEPIAPDVAALVGEWAEAPYVNRDGSTYQQLLSLRPDHSYVAAFRTYQATSAGNMGLLMSYTLSEGTFIVRDDSLFRTPTVIRNWDRNFNSGEVIVTPVTPSGPNGSGGERYELSAGSLILHYLTYPADAAVETMTLYSRVP